MEQRIIEALLTKQRAETEDILKMDCHPRHAAKRIGCLEPVQIIQGVRSSGKTFTTLHTLRSRGLKFAYVDLSHPALRSLESAVFDRLVEGLMMVYGGFQYIVIDEFSFNPDWADCIGAFLAQGIQIIGITSKETPTDTLPFRVSTLKFHTLSFSEYCLWHNIDPDDHSLQNKATIRRGFDDFLYRGGFPRLQEMGRPKPAARRIAETVIKLDAQADFRKNMVDRFHSLAEHLLENSAELLNYKQLAEKFGMRSEITVKKYIEMIKASSLQCPLRRFAMHEKTRNVYEKLYVADTALLPRGETGKSMETAVYLQLRRFCERYGYFMHYYANRQVECNFALCVDMKMRTLLQVIPDYSDSATIKEKVAGLKNLSKMTGCDQLYILTDSNRDIIEEKDLKITVMPAYEFLLDRSHKIIS